MINRALAEQQALLKKAYLEACEGELQAFKPGNVSVWSAGHGMVVEDFRRSAEVSAEAITEPSLSLGEKIYYAIETTQAEVGCNTNLGIVLLCAPFCQAMQSGLEHGSLKARLKRVLDATTERDSEWVYRAIRLAKPAGLGNSEQQDVAEHPVVTLKQAMSIACERDRIACQYVTSYSDIFNLAMPRFHRAMAQWNDERWATVAVFTDLLSRYPDSHVTRKYGNQFTTTVTKRMTALNIELSKTDRPEQLLHQLHAIDAAFKSDGINPGTTADLTVACLLAVRLNRILNSRADQKMND